MIASTAPRPRVARDVMTPHPICVCGGDTVRDLAEVFDANRISGVPVVDIQDRVIGVVSRTDLLHRLVEGPPGARSGESYLDLVRMAGSEFREEDLGTVEDVMSTDPITVPPDAPVAEMARQMSRNRVHRVIVVDEQHRPIGMATTLDLLAVFPD